MGKEKEEGREESRPRKRTAILSGKQVAACRRVFPNTLLGHSVNTGNRFGPQICCGLQSFGP